MLNLGVSDVRVYVGVFVSSRDTALLFDSFIFLLQQLYLQDAVVRA